jgi:hypothetical protein
MVKIIFLVLAILMSINIHGNAQWIGNGRLYDEIGRNYYQNTVGDTGFKQYTNHGHFGYNKRRIRRKTFNY